jgi:hypothetical protein
MQEDVEATSCGYALGTVGSPRPHWSLELKKGRDGRDAGGIGRYIGEVKEKDETRKRASEEERKPERGGGGGGETGREIEIARESENDSESESESESVRQCLADEKVLKP